MKPLLIELGCEELPAGTALPAAEALREKLLALLRDSRLEYGKVHVYHAPRRLALLLDGVAACGTAVTVEKTGPAVKAAYGADGKPTKAAEGFARGAGVAVDKLFTVKTEKGEYIAAKVELPAVQLAELLLKNLPAIVAALPFPKNMRWDETRFTFSRPLRWLVVLHDAQVVPVIVAGLTAGNRSYGHRYHAPGPVAISRAAEYLAALRPAFVIPDAAERRRLIAAGAQQVAPAGGFPALDDRLLDEVADLVEFPCPFRADFDARYLAIPTPVLVGAMKKHQRYFPVYADEQRTKLLPCFIGVANGDEKQFDLNAVREGNTRVLRARFDDAEFFFKTDTAKPLAEYIPELDRIMYEKTLGSIGERVKRIDALVAELVRHGDYTALVAQQAHSVARVCKADLATKMVFEFTELQGVIGSEYAAREKYEGPVVRGIAQHYWPTGPDCAVPGEEVGALVALADKFDALAGGFATGKEPTGSADPYALRRAALGIIRILAHAYPHGRMHVPVRGVFRVALEQVAGKVKFDREPALAKVMAFVQGRLENFLRESAAYSPAEVEAVLAVAWETLDEVVEKLDAVSALRKSGLQDDLAALAAALKRAQNITRGVQGIADRADAALCREDAERELLTAVAAADAKLQPLLEQRKYEPAMRELVTLRPVLDRFFTDVLVMCPEVELKQNRLALARQVAGLFLRVADFTKLG